jgi:small-conductance mechanosensitive channel
MKIEQTLDKIHALIIQNRLLQIFTAFTRILLAIGFIPPSIKKIMNEPFTSLPDTNPVGHYFNALYQTGFYYQFIGWAQLIAAILLLFPRTAHLGALMFFPIILNIAVLTSSVGFQGTWIITIFMCLAAFYLVCWDFDRLKPILFLQRKKKATIFKNELIWLPILFAVGGITAYVFLAYFLLNTISSINPVFLLILGVLGFGFGLFIALHHKFMRTGTLEIDKEMM